MHFAQDKLPGVTLVTSGDDPVHPTCKEPLAALSLLQPLQMLQAGDAQVELLLIFLEQKILRFERLQALFHNYPKPLGVVLINSFPPVILPSKKHRGEVLGFFFFFLPYLCGDTPGCFFTHILLCIIHFLSC